MAAEARGVEDEVLQARQALRLARTEKEEAAATLVHDALGKLHLARMKACQMLALLNPMAFSGPVPYDPAFDLKNMLGELVSMLEAACSRGTPGASSSA
eukprot:TRINITY_DN3599_c0_g1_i1.p1 TRINITY_DN3599_c0_g1~~TRINITY_DN3599_c0_g1_i1.p1  ORF type:complete len:112 (+),score=20.51 TRINITY_DN3599_c0_g1_i1:41-337(+)